MWACGAAGSALPWHGRGHRFDPDQVHQIPHQTNNLEMRLLLFEAARVLKGANLRFPSSSEATSFPVPSHLPLAFERTPLSCTHLELRENWHVSTALEQPSHPHP